MVPNWSSASIKMEFVTRLPLSNEFKVILAVVNWFSKGAQIKPLAKLPIAKETPELILHHVACLHDVLPEAVSDSPIFQLLQEGFLCPGGHHPSSVLRVPRRD